MKNKTSSLLVIYLLFKSDIIKKQEKLLNFIKHIQYLKKSTGEFEGVYHFSNLKPGPFHEKFILMPGIYDIY